MTDHNVNSEKDNVYIQSLLDRLRATIGTTESEGETEGEAPATSYDIPRTTTIPETEEDDPMTGEAVPLVPPIIPGEPPLPLTEVPPVAYPDIDAPEPTPDEESEGADPTPGEEVPPSEAPMPEVDPFAPMDAPDEVPEDVPVETPLVGEPEAFPRYEGAIPETDIPEEEPVYEAPPVHMEIEEEMPATAETASAESIAQDTSSDAPTAEERIRTILEKEPPIAYETPYSRKPDEVTLQSRLVTSGARVTSHPVGHRYRSFPVPDAVVSVPIIDTAVSTKTDVMKDPSVTEQPRAMEDTPVVETPGTPHEVPVPHRQTPVYSADVMPPVLNDSLRDVPTVREEPPTVSELIPEEDIPIVPIAVPNPEEQTTVVSTQEAPLTHEDGEESGREKSAPKPSGKGGFKALIHGILDDKGSPVRMRLGFPFGVNSIVHAETEEGKRLRKQGIGQQLLSGKIMCWFSAVLLLLLFLWEIMPGQMDILLSRLLLTRVPGAAILIDLQLLLLLCLVGYRPIIRGYGALVRGKIIPETLTAIGVTVSVILEICLYLMNQIVPYTVGFLAGCLVTASVLADYFRTGSLACAMRVYSLRDKDTYIGCMEGGAMTVERCLGTARFDRRTARRYENPKSLWFSLIVASVASIAYFLIFFGGVGKFNSLFLDRAIWGTATVFCASIPVSVFAVHGVLFGILGQRLAEDRVGISDESVVDEFCGIKDMVFDDQDAFPSGAVRVCGIKLRGDFRMDSALFLASSVFHRLGGPLDLVFGLSTANVNLTDQVEIRTLEDEGVEARVNGEDVCIGTKEYLGRLGIPVYRDEDDVKAEEEKNAILCVAYRNQMCAKFYIRYCISTVFESNVEYYAAHGVRTILRTADPMLTMCHLDRISYVSGCNLEIVKCLPEDKEKAGVVLESGLMSVGPRKTLRRMPFFFRAYHKCREFLAKMSVVATLVNAVLVPTVMLAVPSDAFMKTPLAGALCQLFWLVPTAIICSIVTTLNPNREPQSDKEAGKSSSKS